MREVGRVLSVTDDTAKVAMRASGACEKCGLCLSSSDGKEVMLIAKNDVGAAQGEAVEVEVTAGRVLIAAFALYMVPVLMTILGFLVGNSLSGGSEESVLPIVMAVVFLAASFVTVWLFDLRSRKRDRPDARVTRILSDEEAASRIRIVTLGGE